LNVIFQIQGSKFKGYNIGTEGEKVGFSQTLQPS